MKAVTWHGQRDVRVEEVPDPFVQEPTDAVIRVTTSNICGSDLHLYEPLAPFMGVGNILGHENMGQVVEVGSECGNLKVGDRVSIPFQISCGHCWMCKQQLYTQCETTQVRDQGMGAALFGFSKLYGEVPDGGTLVVLGLGPIGDFACRIAQHKGYRVIGVDLVPERLERVRARGVEVVDLSEHEDDLGDVIRDMTGGRGPDSVLDASAWRRTGRRRPPSSRRRPGCCPRPSPHRS